MYFLTCPGETKYLIYGLKLKKKHFRNIKNISNLTNLITFHLFNVLGQS